MKRFLFAIICALTLGGPAWTDTLTLAATSGELLLMRDGEIVDGGAVLIATEGDTILTGGADTMAVGRFEDGTVLALIGDTTISVDVLNHADATLDAVVTLVNGALEYNSEASDARDRYVALVAGEEVFYPQGTVGLLTYTVLIPHTPGVPIGLPGGPRTRSAIGLSPINSSSVLTRVSVAAGLFGQGDVSTQRSPLISGVAASQQSTPAALSAAARLGQFDTVVGMNQTLTVTPPVRNPPTTTGARPPTPPAPSGSLPPRVNVQPSTYAPIVTNPIRIGAVLRTMSSLRINGSAPTGAGMGLQSNAQITSMLAALRSSLPTVAQSNNVVQTQINGSTPDLRALLPPRFVSISPLVSLVDQVAASPG